MEENNSDKESFYSADSLENLAGEEKLKQTNFSPKKNCKENIVTVPYYEGEILVPLNCISNMVKSSFKKKLVQNKTLSSNVSRYDNNSLRLNFKSLGAPSETTGSIPSKFRSSSVCPGKNVQGLMSKSSSRSKIIEPNISSIRPRNRSVSYLEQYRKRLSSSCNRNNLYSSTTTINTSVQSTSIWQDDYFSPTNSLNGSQNNTSNNGDLLEKDVKIPVHHETQTQTTVSKSRSSNYIKKTSGMNKNLGLYQTKAVQSNDFLMQPNQNKQSNDKLASLKKRKEYSEAVKKKNQEEFLVQNAQTKVRGRSTEKTITNNLPFNFKTEKLPPPTINNFSSIEKRKEFSDKVKHKNREEFLCQKIQQKAMNARRTKEIIIANEDCFTQKIDSTLQLDKPLVKPKFSATHRKKEAIQTNEQKQIKNFEDMTDLEALQMRHEKDKIKAKCILNEFLRT